MVSSLPERLPEELVKRRHQLMDSLEREYSERAYQYKVCIVEGLLRKEGEAWMPETLTVRFWHAPTGRANEDIKYSGGARLVRSELSADEGRGLLTRLREDVALDIPGVGRVFIGEQSGLLEVNNSYVSPPGIGWRCVHASLYTATSISMLRNDILVSPDGPLYPDAEKAVFAWTGTHVNWGAAPGERLTVILPEFACRIAGLALGRTETDVILEPGPTPPMGVVGQYFAAADGQPIVTGRFEGPVARHTVTIGFVPEQFQVNVFDRDSRRFLDGRSYRRGLVYESQGVTWKEREENLRAMILEGESEYLEFKEAWNGDDPRRFKEAVTALANSTSGGTVVFGVKNSPVEVVGVGGAWNLDQWRRTLTNAVRDSISPVPELQVSEEKVPERLILIQIAPGSRPPYLLRNRGVLIRAGSSNRVPEQYELVELVKRGLPQDPR